MSYKWTFEQMPERVSTLGQPKTLTLEGWAAPHGRARKNPIFKEVIKSRVQTTRYPGQSGAPTRHVFGTHWEDMELTGRWMDRHLASAGKTAEDVVAEWQEFVRDERTLRVAWGPVVSYTGFIEELETAYESPNEVAYRIKLLVDKRDEASTTGRSAQPSTPINDQTEAALTTWANLGELLEAVSVDMEPDFFDSLNRLGAELNKPQAAFNNFVNQLDSFEKKTFGAIASFRTAITGFRAGILGMRDVILNAQLDTAITVHTAKSDVAWFQYQLAFDDQTYEILAILADLDRQAELAGRDVATKLVTALEGDTWDSLSTRATGGVDGSTALRELNGGKYGEQPRAGHAYLVP